MNAASIILAKKTARLVLLLMTEAEEAAGLDVTLAPTAAVVAAEAKADDAKADDAAAVEATARVEAAAEDAAATVGTTPTGKSVPLDVGTGLFSRTLFTSLIGASPIEGVGASL